MRHHFQGLVLLVVVLAALWGTVRMAAPVLDSAFSGEDSALRAESSEDVVELSTAVEGAVALLAGPLTAEEIVDLQALLTEAGYDPGPIDGLMGPSTAAAAAQAQLDRQMPANSSDRALLERLQLQNNDPGTTTALTDGIDWEAIGELVADG